MYIYVYAGCYSQYFGVDVQDQHYMYKHFYKYSLPHFKICIQ